MARQYSKNSGVAVIACLAFLVIQTRDVDAQISLPGAVAPTPVGTVTKAAKPKSRSGGGMGEARLKAVMPKAPAEDALIDKTLKLDGVGSELQITRAGTDFQVGKLVFVGDRLSRSGEKCRYEAPGAPLKLSARESGAGLRRYQVEFSDCAFSFDILDGAILATNDGKICEIKSADCRIDPEGLWGMGENEFDPKTAVDMLGARAKVERTVRSNFRTLYDRYKGDKALRAFIVSEQAGFSSWREEICRSYVRESDFGYCALRLTEARVISLGAQLASGIKQPEEKPSPPTAAAQPSPAAPGPALSAPPPTTAAAPPSTEKFTPVASPTATGEK